MTKEKKDDAFAVADLEDLFITRDDDGNIAPVEVMSPLLGKVIKLVPMTYGYIKSRSLDMEVSAVRWPLADRLDLVKKHIVEPNLDSLTEKMVEERMGPMTLNHLVSLVVAYSVPMKNRQQGLGMLTERLKDLLSSRGSKEQNSLSTSSDTDTPEGEISIP